MLPKFKRILLKLSGEALLGDQRNGDPFNPQIIEQYAHDIKLVTDMGVQVAIVIGGGNIYRGMNEADSGIERAHGDYADAPSGHCFKDCGHPAGYLPFDA